MINLIKQLENYQPYNEQEARDRIEILHRLRTTPDIFTRENHNAHMTASAWVVNETRDKALMVFHNIYNSWSWSGGHADGETDLLHVALREVREECGVKSVVPISEDIFSVEILTVDGHEKNGVYVSSHLHLNVSYLLQADEKDELFMKPDENKGVSWFGLDEAVSASTEPWFQARIYSKLNCKLRGIKG